jgi:Fur family ferric uptake transcriptional regulator
MKTFEHRLKEHHLRVTPIRLELLSYFTKERRAISHADIELHYNHQLDRVTIYRTLNSFIENGLIHKVSDNSAIAKFALCNHKDCAHNHEDNHVHFKCIICEKIECLHQLSIPNFNLPKNYSITAANLLIEGKCASCN